MREKIKLYSLFSYKLIVMQPMYKQNKKLYGITGLFIITVWMVGITSSYAIMENQETADSVEVPAVVMEEKTDPSFTYIMEGRPDPFVPFITKTVVTRILDPDEILDEEGELTGMRQFEPGQLTLVAIIKGEERGRVAMVEDVTGRGYMLNEGVPIGRRGVVTEITANEVLIVETSRTRAGKEIKNTIVMRLNKEGE